MQRVDLDDTHDPFSDIDYDDFDAFTGRLGVRLEADTTLNGVPVKPFVDVNLWHNFSADYSVVFNDRSLTTEIEGTSLEVGTGISALLTNGVRAFGAVQYTTDLDGQDSEGFGGNIGVRVNW